MEVLVFRYSLGDECVPHPLINPLTCYYLR